MSKTIKDTLAERDSVYGSYKTQSSIAQELKMSAKLYAKDWDSMTADKKESIEMILHKIARILNGNPDYHDNWHDIAGYATLVADTLTTEN